MTGIVFPSIEMSPPWKPRLPAAGMALLVLALLSGCRPSKASQGASAPVATAGDPSPALDAGAPKDAEGWRDRARNREHEGDLEGAIHDFGEAIKLVPEDSRAWRDRGWARVLDCDGEGAISDFTKALDLEPADSSLWAWRARAKYIAGDNEGALSDCDKALELCPGDKNAREHRAITRGKIGDLDGAILDCDEEIRRFPDATEAYLWRGICHYMSGNPQAALEEFTAHIQTNGFLADDYAALYRWAIRVRFTDKKEAGAELRAYVGPSRRLRGTVDHALVQRWGRPYWPSSVLAFCLGTISRDELFADLEHLPKGERHGNSCEAWFDAGIAALGDGDEAEGIRCLENAVATRERDFTEYDLAVFELKTIRGKR
ncbi:MAG: tetratricopeptide repeat protein [Planctomycetes bacterium]|nr:tetratricopeptide repeat protein [Planctomycetota bacterium]